MLGRTCPEREVASWIDVVRQAFFCFENLIQDLVFFPIAESRLADFVIEESVPVCSVAFIGSLECFLQTQYLVGGICPGRSCK